jgi:Fe-S cluster biosynthesis and repair protein YggX
MWIYNMKSMPSCRIKIVTTPILWYIAPSKVEGKLVHFFLRCTMPWGRVLDLGASWRWVVSFTPWPLYPQKKSPCYPLDRRLGGLQSRSGRRGEEKNFQPLPGFEHPIIQPVVQRMWNNLLEISRLLVTEREIMVNWPALRSFLQQEYSNAGYKVFYWLKGN